VVTAAGDGTSAGDARVPVRRGIAARHGVDIAENRATDLAGMQRRKARPPMSELGQKRNSQCGWPIPLVAHPEPSHGQ